MNRVLTKEGTGSYTTSYNILNLPDTVTLPHGNIVYTYDAAGEKLNKTVKQDSTTITTDYISDIQYANGKLAFIQTEEGRALPDTLGNYNYEYTLADHLGNSRVSFTTKGDSTTVIQQDDYMPFGMEIAGRLTANPKNEYLYNKKELQLETGLYDYGARFYDPVIARWTTIDPLAEKSRRFTPYAYGKDNPIIIIDPDGMFDQYFRENGKYLGKDENGDNGKVRIVTDKKEIATIKANEKAGGITNSSDVTSGASTTKVALGEAVNVLDRTNANGGDKEERSTVTADGTISRAGTGPAQTSMVNGVEVATTTTDVPNGTGNTLIHSHITAVITRQDGSPGASSAEEPGPADPATFKNFSSNIIVGNLGLPTIQQDALGKQTTTMPQQGAVLFNSSTTKQAEVTKSALQKIVKTP